MGANLALLLVLLGAGESVPVSPFLGIAALLGLLFVGMAMARPKLALGIGVCAMLVAPAARQASGVELLGFVDEGVVLVLAGAFVHARFASGLPLRRLPGWRWLLLYLGAGVVSSFAHRVPALLAAQDAFLFTKGAILAFGVAQLDWDHDDLRRAVRVGAGVGVGVLVVTLANLALPSSWYARFTTAGHASYRGAFPSLVGPFVHPGVFGQAMALLGLAALASREALGATRSRASLAVLALLGAMLSYRRKAVVGFLAGAAYVLVMLRRRRFPAIVAALLVTLCGWLALQESIRGLADRTYVEYVQNGSQGARVTLYNDSAGLARSEFPFGVGLSRFGGYMAISNYSPLYDDLGYRSVYGLGPGEDFATDTFWPAVIGETGWLGAAGYAAFLVAMLRLFRGLTRARAPEHRLVGIVGVAWFIEFAIESVAAPAYSSPPMFVLLFGLMGIAAALPTGATDVRVVAGTTDTTEHRLVGGRSQR